MGAYSVYLDTLKGFDAFTTERKKQLKRISDIRKTDVLVIAAAFDKNNNAGIDHSDIVPIADQLEGLTGTELDVILETGGGSGEVTEEIVGLFRKRHTKVNFIVPGTAKSAGTIMVMAGDDILMGTLSSLGPIDAQVSRNGKMFSAEAFLEGLDKIKEESDEKKYLNRAYIPILQAISPGEIEAAKNALKFGKTLAANWLEKYKFHNWTHHKSSGLPVTDIERRTCAREIAEKLGSHTKWLSHGRSIKISDLRGMGIQITDFEATPDLADAIRRYYILMRMSFEMNIYKIYETTGSQIYRFQNGAVPLPTPVPALPAPANDAQIAVFQFTCPKCKKDTKVQANLFKAQPLVDGAVLFPKSNKLTCSFCGTESDLTVLRMQIEAQSKKPIV